MNTKQSVWSAAAAILVLATVGGWAMAAAPAAKAGATAPASTSVTVDEGTSMAVAVSPDGKTLAMDLQGAIWVMPASGGAAKRITDIYDDAHQPSWAPDGSEIAFFSYRSGDYDIWEVKPDGSDLRQLTQGAFDDREPVFSHDGMRVAFSSDRANQPSGSYNVGNYNIFVLDLKSRTLRQLTTNPAEDTMPSWSPDDKEIAFVSTRDGGRGAWAVGVDSGTERKLADTSGRADAVSWGPGGDVVVHSVDPESRTGQLEVNAKPFTAKGENVFPFRPSWISKTAFLYTADGKIKRRTLGSADAQNVPFTATFQVTPVQNTYARKKRSFEAQSPRKAMGIVRPVLSPDGKSIAFAALGDIYVMEVGKKPRAITHDAAYDTDPAWSPDGQTLAYTSDKVGPSLQLWLHNMTTGEERQITHLTTQPMSSAFSPDGKRIAFLNSDGMYRHASIDVIDVGSGQITTIHDSLLGPGEPTWSADGSHIAVTIAVPFSKKYREGTNQVLVMSATGPADGSQDKWYSPIPNVSIDSRGGSGPVWSPDGTRMAAIYGAQLALFPVSPSGEPTGPVRHITEETAYSPSWARDGRHILYLSNDKFRILDVDSGAVQTVALDLTYRQYVPKGHFVLHVGKLVDGVSRSAKSDMDIVIDGNLITSVQPHVASRNAIDLPDLTAMPGLIESHTHRESNMGERQGRAFLSWGITTIRNPGELPYEAVEDREAGDAGIRVQPRMFNTGYLLDGTRVYYKTSVAISSNAQLERELERSRILGFDLLKGYVRLSDPMLARMVAFGHQYGIPSTSHELFPAVFSGIDSVEHQGATSRRGYSLKNTFNRSYEDVIQLMGRAQVSMTPTVFPGMPTFLSANPQMLSDPRLSLDPPWLKAQITALANRPSGDESGIGKMILDAQKAGARIVAGTDEMDGMYLQAELSSYVQFGMTPYDALRAATVTPAELLQLNAGSIQPGKLADIILVEGNPLDDIANTRRIKRVVANGRMFTIDDLLSGKAKDAPH